MRRIVLIFVLAAFGAPVVAAAAETLPDTQPVRMQGDLSKQMVAGIDRYLMRMIDESVKAREARWQRDFSSALAQSRSVEPNRRRFRKMIGVVDQRLPASALEFVATTSTPSKLAETKQFAVHAVRWPVFPGVHGEGLLLQPHDDPIAHIVVIPDADQTPEQLVGLTDGIDRQSQYARRLAEKGFQVVVPVLIDRNSKWSGNPEVRMTEQPHREWIYRQAYQLGRHIIGYEVQKVLAVVDWFMHRAGNDDPCVGVAGYGEGALIALYAAAVDTRIDAAMVSGYFGPRERIWEEPIDRNVFGLLQEFGDAEIASLIYPRQVVIEHAAVPSVETPVVTAGRQEKTPGKIQTRRFPDIIAEMTRSRNLVRETVSVQDSFIRGRLTAETDDSRPQSFGRSGSLEILRTGLGLADVDFDVATETAPPNLQHFDPALRQGRQVDELVAFTQKLHRRSEQVRREFWSDAQPSSTDEWRKACRKYQRYFWDKIIGRLPAPTMPPNVRTRKIYDKPKWTGYEVVIDVWPDVFAWGYLLIPKDLKRGERRPVVVCQHGLEGLPESVVTADPSDRASRVYHSLAVKLCERGFVTYAPHNPYRGEQKFRVLQRKANVLGKSLYSIILAQHERTLDFLSTLEFVDSGRIGFYGLSYGGLTAVTVPPLLDRYALSICSACFNDWNRKVVSLDFRASYMFTRETDHFTFDLGNTFNHADLAGMVAPRPFMVERGHADGVAPDEWVAYEYAKVRRLYAQLGIANRTAIEFFDGGHVINGKGTFEFLHKHLDWPATRTDLH